MLTLRSIVVALSLLSIPSIPAAARSPRPIPVADRDGHDGYGGYAYRVGSATLVLWGGTWWHAHVIDERAGLYKIRYDGYGPEWDEWLETYRMRPRDDGPAHERTGLHPGAAILVEWGGRWWNASVLDTRGAETFIHYDGYGPEWDEWVGPERLQRRGGRAI